MKQIFFLKRDILIITGLVIIHVAGWLWLKPITPHSDPLCYYINVQRIIHHEHTVTYSTLDHRYSLILPAAAFVTLLGDNPYAISLWPLLCSLLTIVLVYGFVSVNLSRQAAVISALLLAVNHVQIIHAAVLFPDGIVSMFTAFCACIVYSGRKEGSHPREHAFLLVLLFAVGFFAKEMIVLLLPFVVLIAWVDIKNKSHLLFWKSAAVFFLILFSLLLILPKLATGDFFYLYQSVEKQHNEGFVPYYNFSSIVKRIYEPFIWLNFELGYVFLLVFSLPAVIGGVMKRDNFKSIESFIALYFITIFFSLWWGTSSVTRFAPMFLLDRMWMQLFFPSCILSAITIHGILQNKISVKWLCFLIFTFVLLGIINTINISIIRGALFFAFASMLLLQELLRNKIRNDYWIRTGLVALPFIILAIQFLRTNSNYVIPAN